jgi:hypothetical protein
MGGISCELAGSLVRLLAKAGNGFDYARRDMRTISTVHVEETDFAVEIGFREFMPSLETS